MFPRVETSSSFEVIVVEDLPRAHSPKPQSRGGFEDSIHHLSLFSRLHEEGLDREVVTYNPELAERALRMYTLKDGMISSCHDLSGSSR